MKKWPVAVLVLLILLFPLIVNMVDLAKILWVLVFSKVYSDDVQNSELPQVIHQIAYYKSESDVPEHWKSCSQFWKDYNPDWTVKRWNQEQGDALVKNEFAWLWDVYDGYSNVVQKVDMLRLMILYKEGGIYSDLDVCAKKSFNELRNYEFAIPLTEPHGYSNYLMLSRAKHPLLMHFLSNFRHYNRFWFLPYLKVMCSTGPFLITYLMHSYPFQNEIRRLPDHWSTREYMSFRMGSSWHEWDSTFLIAFYNNLYLILILAVVALFILLRVCCKKKNNSPLIPLFQKQHDS
eukprot:NODE_765_length_4403_cov_0.417054.p1 type:complete len:291 gc:universal NODE_765_length_4403_cov_0.417054:1748-876(-)